MKADEQPKIAEDRAAWLSLFAADAVVAEAVDISG